MWISGTGSWLVVKEVPWKLLMITSPSIWAAPAREASGAKIAPSHCTCWLSVTDVAFPKFQSRLLALTLPLSFTVAILLRSAWLNGEEAD